MAPEKRIMRFRKVIGDRGADALALAGIIGSGIFFIIGIAAGVAGTGIVISIVIAGIIAILTAMSFATLGSCITKEGGEYEFVYTIMGPTTGFIVGIGWIAATAISGVTVSIALASYLYQILPYVPINIMAADVCIAFTILEVFGLRLSKDVSDVLVLIKVSVLVFFITLTLPAVHISNFSGIFATGYKGILTAAFLIFFAYAGFGKITSAAEEIKGAKKAIPKAIFFSVSLTTILYILVTVAAVGAVGAAVLSSPSVINAPLAGVMKQLGYGWGFYVIIVGALTAMASVLIMQLVGVSRSMYAMSVNKQLPELFSKIHPKLNTPYRAVIIIGLIMATMALFINTNVIVSLTGLGILSYYAVINITTVVMRKRRARRFQLRDALSALGAVMCIMLIVYFLSTLILP